VRGADGTAGGRKEGGREGGEENQSKNGRAIPMSGEGVETALVRDGTQEKRFPYS